MKYQIIELTEDKLDKFSGKIVQVIKREQQHKIRRTKWFEMGTYCESKWVLTCLVEVEQ